MSKAHLTAIARSTPSAPARWLDARGFLRGKMLDYGCGRGYDADYFGMDKYDPHWNPEYPEDEYDVITCTYVLNVIEDEAERKEVVDRILQLLAPGGEAFIAVRNDTDQLNGKTSKGTWQGEVEPYRGTLLTETAGFRIYQLEA